MHSPNSIKRLIEQIYGLSMPCFTLYRHLKKANATRIKLDVLRKKIRKRWTRNHTHDLWVGDFEDEPYVLQNSQVVPTYLSAFIDCHSRYAVEGLCYFRQNLDVLIDSLIHALFTHGATLQLYVDELGSDHSDRLTIKDVWEK